MNWDPRALRRQIAADIREVARRRGAASADADPACHAHSSASDVLCLPPPARRRIVRPHEGDPRS